MLVLLATSMSLSIILEITNYIGAELSMLRRFLVVECLVFFRYLLVKGLLMFLEETRGDNMKHLGRN